MNKILLTSICAAALTSAASAFTLDLSALNGSNLGTGSITQDGHTFQLTATGTIPVSGGVAQFDAGESLTIIYPTTVTYIGAFITGEAVVDDTPQTVKYTATENGVGVEDIRFSEVPEPSSTALLGLGGLALVLRRRK